MKIYNRNTGEWELEEGDHPPVIPDETEYAIYYQDLLELISVVGKMDNIKKYLANHPNGKKATSKKMELTEHQVNVKVILADIRADLGVLDIAISNLVLMRLEIQLANRDRREYYKSAISRQLAKSAHGKLMTRLTPQELEKQYQRNLRRKMVK